MLNFPTFIYLTLFMCERFAISLFVTVRTLSKRCYPLILCKLATGVITTQRAAGRGVAVGSVGLRAGTRGLEALQWTGAGRTDPS